MKKILFIGLLFVLAGTGVWSQEVSDSVRIHYRRGYRGVDPDYHNNRSELERFIRTLRREQESARLERVVICSWTSPDGVTRYNELLAGRRADSLKSWLVRHAQIPGELVSVRGEGIGWGVLRQLVAVSDMLYKDEVLHILDNTPVWIRDSHGKIVDGRKKQLMDLRGGQPYNYMMENIFPEVRSSLSTICYRKSAPSIDKVTTGTAPTDSALAEKEETETAGFRNTTALISAGPGANTPAETSPVTSPKASGKLREALAQNLVIKTNLLYDALLMPSLEAEYRFNDRWTVNLEGEIAWWKNDGKHKYYQLATISPEVRWWFGQQKNNPWHGHYLGLFGGFSWFDLENKENGYQGEAEIAGLSYGYMFPIARRLSLEAGLGLGYLHSKYEEYEPVPHMGGTHYVYLQTKRVDYFGPLKLKLALVWHLQDINRKKGGAQ